MVVAQATVLIQLGVYAIIKDNMDVARAFGFATDKQCPVIIGLILSQVLLTPIGQVISLATNVMSRIFEFQVGCLAIVAELTVPLARLFAPK